MWLAVLLPWSTAPSVFTVSTPPPPFDFVLAKALSCGHVLCYPQEVKIVRCAAGVGYSVFISEAGTAYWCGEGIGEMKKVYIHMYKLQSPLIVKESMSVYMFLLLGVLLNWLARQPPLPLPAYCSSTNCTETTRASSLSWYWKLTCGAQNEVSA